MAKGAPRGRGKMRQVLTPEERAALLEGLREAGAGQDSELRPLARQDHDTRAGLPGTPPNFTFPKFIQLADGDDRDPVALLITGLAAWEQKSSRQSS
jgi:hypothetical protein